MIEKKRHAVDPMFNERTLCGRRITRTIVTVLRQFRWTDPSMCTSCRKNADTETLMNEQRSTSTAVSRHEHSSLVNLALGLGPEARQWEMTEWFRRHELAATNPRGSERGIVALIIGWANYAIVHRAMNEAPIGNDQVIGKAWQSMGRELIVLLNAELDRLDGGQLDAGIRAFAKHEGVELE